MRKYLSTLTALLLALALTLTGAGTAFAADTPSPQPFAAKSTWLTIKKPAAKAVFYKGERIPVKVAIRNPGKGYRAATVFVLRQKGSDVPVWVNADLAVGHTWTGSAKTSLLLPAGTYTLSAVLAGVPVESATLPVDVTKLNSLTSNFSTFLTYVQSLPLSDTAEVNLTLKLLNAPTGLKAKAGRRRVTISYRKAAGATKYEIYRSSKQAGGYKKIATTKKTSYTDKSLKKGKKYYYKVRSIRTGKGTVKSIYSPVKRSGTVKR